MAIDRVTAYPLNALWGLAKGERQWIWFFAVGLFAFVQNLSISLFEGSEGLYAQIAREMALTKQFFSLTYQEEPYSNKPPLFFWLLALSTGLLGENEIALRCRPRCSASAPWR